MGAAVAVITLRRWRNRDRALDDSDDRASRRVALKFLLGIAVAPVLWLAYNAAVYGNALEFANGPYSAKAIEQRVGAPNPALHNIGVAAVYFLEIGAVEYGGRELGPVLAGGGPCGVGHRSMETADAIGADAVAVGPAAVLRVFDCLRLGAASCSHLVAICYF